MNSIPKITPFNIPDTYFDNLADNVMSIIKSEKQEDVVADFGKVSSPLHLDIDYFDKLSNWTEQMMKEVKTFENQFGTISLPFHINNDYFDNLYNEVWIKLNHSEFDLTDISFIDSFSREMPYTLSGEYFDNLEKEIPYLISEDIDKDLKSLIGTHNPFALPEGYFEHVAEEEDHFLKANVGLAMPYRVPNGYLESINTDELLQLERLNKNADQYKKPKKILRMVRWAAAASLALLFGIGSYVLRPDPNQKMGNDAQLQLAAIPKEDVSDYIHSNIAEFDLVLIESASIKNKGTIINSESLLNEVNDEDIKSYLEAEGI